MGNLISSRAADSCGGKVVLPDGAVHELDRRTSVAELMLEHPQHFVVDVRSLQSAGNPKVIPLPADDMLEPDRAYVMLPMARGTPAGGLSADEARRVLARSNTQKSQPASAFLRALSTRTVITAEGKQQAESTTVDQEAKIGGAKWPLEVLEERPELLTRQYSSRRWRPSLGTIEERSLERKLSHWLL